MIHSEFSHAILNTMLSGPRSLYPSYKVNKESKAQSLKSLFKVTHKWQSWGEGSALLQLYLTATQTTKVAGP